MASYQVEVSRQARREIRNLSGNMRQRVIRALRALGLDPRPHNSRPLDTSKARIVLDQGSELHRMRMASWRVVYLVEDDWQRVLVLAIRRRPPYQYDDLEQLVETV